MKPPDEISGKRELVELIQSEWEVRGPEVREIWETVLSNFEQQASTNQPPRNEDAIIHVVFREAQERHKNRQKYATEEAVNQVRKELGGILKNKFPNKDPDHWIAECTRSRCQFDFVVNDSKVDTVLCPECTHQLHIDPAPE